MAEPVIRQYRESDLAEATAFLRANFARWPPFPVAGGDEEHLGWKLASHPLAPKDHWVAELDERIVGTHFAWAQDALLRGQRVVVTGGADAAVAEDVRGRGVLSAMRSTRDAVVRATFDLRISRGAHAAVNRVRDRDGESRFGNAVELLEASTAWPGLSDVLRRRTAPTVRRIERFDASSDDLWERSRHEFDFAIDRSHPHLNWRYGDPRGGASERGALFDGAAMRGYFVVRTAGSRAVLSDILVAPEDEAALMALLRAARAASRRTGARRLRAWLPALHPYRAAFARAGFAATGQTVDLRFSRARLPWEEIAFLGEPDARVHFAMGDLDAG